MRQLARRRRRDSAWDPGGPDSESEAVASTAPGHGSEYIMNLYIPVTDDDFISTMSSTKILAGKLCTAAVGVLAYAGYRYMLRRQVIKQH